MRWEAAWVLPCVGATIFVFSIRMHPQKYRGRSQLPIVSIAVIPTHTAILGIPLKCYAVNAEQHLGSL